MFEALIVILCWFLNETEDHCCFCVTAAHQKAQDICVEMFLFFIGVTLLLYTIMFYCGSFKARLFFNRVFQILRYKYFLGEFIKSTLSYHQMAVIYIFSFT